jgi:hypothetical protein
MTQSNNNFSLSHAVRIPAASLYVHDACEELILAKHSDGEEQPHTLHKHAV